MSVLRGGFGVWGPSATVSLRFKSPISSFRLTMTAIRSLRLGPVFSVSSILVSALLYYAIQYDNDNLPT